MGRLLERLLALALFMPLMFAGAWLGFEIPGIDHDTRTIFFLGWMIAMAFVVDRICTNVFREKQTADLEVVYGKDCKTPLSPLEWAESLREIATYLQPRAQGAGQTGYHGGKATKKFSGMTETERIKLYRKDPAKYRQLREAIKQA